VLIKGRQAQGSILTKNEVAKIALKQRGGSTLGGRKVWFDRNVQRLNYEEHGEFLGEFNEGDSVLVVLENGDFYTTDFNLSNHYEENVKFLKKYNPNMVWTAIIRDADQNDSLCLKRFCFEATSHKQNYLGDNKSNQLLILTSYPHSRFEVIFGGEDAFRKPMYVNAEEFPLRGIKARGKRLSPYVIETIKEDNVPSPTDESIIDDTGQMKLFE
jgi:topoisomerase-4 subunit A